jgi:hypothetical protein
LISFGGALVLAGLLIGSIPASFDSARVSRRKGFTERLLHHPTFQSTLGDPANFIAHQPLISDSMLSGNQRLHKASSDQQFMLLVFYI